MQIYGYKEDDTNHYFSSATSIRNLSNSRITANKIHNYTYNYLSIDMKAIQLNNCLVIKTAIQAY